MGLGAAAGIGVVGSLASGALSSSGAQSAASTAAGAETASAQLQSQEFQEALGNEQPYINAGYTGVNALQSGLANSWSGPLGQEMDLSGMPTSAGVPTAPTAASLMPTQQIGGSNIPQFNWDPTQAGLEQTPGYQFTLQQGLKSAQNAAAARGLGVSGAALKASDTYATGLANTTYNQQLSNAETAYQQQLAGYNSSVNTYNAQTVAGQLGLQDYTQGQLGAYTDANAQYQNQFSDWWADQNNRYNQLSGLATLGANTSVSAGTQSVNSASNVGNQVSAAGQSQASGQVGSSNALSGSLSNITSNPYLYNYLQQQFGGSGSTSYGYSQQGANNVGGSGWGTTI